MIAPIVVHIGGMRSASTYLQNLFARHPGMSLELKSRIFSYQPFWDDRANRPVRPPPAGQVLVDSDENYSLGRFKERLITSADSQFAFKKEFPLLHHDVRSMAARIRERYPSAKILMVIREHRSWIRSVYAHDVLHYGVSEGFREFLTTRVGSSYRSAGDYNAIYDLYTGLFGVDRVRFLLFEDLRSDRRRFLGELSEFIGVEFSDAPPDPANASLGEPVLARLRLANRFAQPKPDRPERRAYFRLRNLVLRNGPIVRRLPTAPFVTAEDLHDFACELVSSNRLLATKIGREEDFERYGYLG